MEERKHGKKRRNRSRIEGRMKELMNGWKEEKMN